VGRWEQLGLKLKNAAILISPMFQAILRGCSVFVTGNRGDSKGLSSKVLIEIVKHLLYICFMAIDSELTASYLHILFEYKDNQLYYRKGDGRKAGSFTDRGYVVVSIRGQSFRAHRLIWIMTNGPIPEGKYIDHINGIKNDNRIENLRLATQTENNRNVKKRKDNTTGVKGVSAAGRKWRAQINVNKKRICLGRYQTIQEAEAAYNNAVTMYHQDFARTG